METNNKLSELDILANILDVLRLQPDKSTKSLDAISGQVGLSKSTLSKIINKVNDVDIETKNKLVHACLSNNIISKLSPDSQKWVQDKAKLLALRNLINTNSESIFNQWINKKIACEFNPKSNVIDTKTGIATEYFLTPLEFIRKTAGESLGASFDVLNPRSIDSQIEMLKELQNVNVEYLQLIESYLEALENIFINLNEYEIDLNKKKNEFIVKFIVKTKLINSIQQDKKDLIQSKINSIPTISSIIGFHGTKEALELISESKKNISDILKAK